MNNLPGNQIADAIEHCCNNSEVEKLYKGFRMIIDRLEKIAPSEESYLIHELENIYNLNTGLIADLSFREGMKYCNQ